MTRIIHSNFRTPNHELAEIPNKTRCSRIRFTRNLSPLTLLLLFAYTAHAQIYVNDDALGLNDGTSWADAFTDLQDALATANSGDEIWVAEGTYLPTADATGNTSPTDNRTKAFVMKNDVAIYGGFAGTETLVSQRDWMTNVTILSGDLNGDDGADFANNSDNSYHVIFNNFTSVNPLTSTAILDGFTITGGNANGNGVHDFGGGMYNVYSSPTVTHCTLSGNAAFYYGGGMYNNLSSSPSLTNCAFSDNEADFSGGGMYNLSTSPSPSLTNCTFSGNMAEDLGGGMHNNNSSPSITNCTFSGNRADYGGGMSNENSSTPSIHNSIIWGNTVIVDGVEIYQIDGTITLEFCLVGNDAGDRSGSIIDNNPIMGAPLFTDAMNGDLTLMSGSPAIDVGSNALYTASGNNLNTDFDLAGNPRLIGGTIDVGAYEFRRLNPMDSPPNCANFSPAIDGMGRAIVSASDFLSNSGSAAYPVTVTVYNQWGGVLSGFPIVLTHPDTTYFWNVCDYLGQSLEFSASNSAGTCHFGRIDLDGTPGVALTSAMQPDSMNPAVTTGRINVYCGDIPAPGEYIPTVVAPCDGRATTPNYQPDWIMPFPCNEESDTAEVIFRTWESYDKEGNLSTITDTIVVFRLPRLTPGAFIGSAEDSFYCELEAVLNGGVALKRYVSWKQPVGLHDYERPYTKLRGVTYEIPATIIIAGLTNAYAQGPDVYDEYLDCVILRKLDGTEVTIRDIVTGDYAADLLAHATDEQKLYGFLQILFELNEKPINVVLETLVEFYPYLLLQEGDWILSEGGNFEQVTSDWFFNGNGNSPYWFAGGWPSIYGSGDCVSYCDTGSGEEFGDCIQIVVPLLDINGLNPQICDTICLPTGQHCGITVKQDTIADWAGICPQTRGLDTRITQTCWAVMPNYCASDVGEGGIVCGEPFVDDNPDDVVVDYSCSDKAVKIHISQWQTLFDTIGPIFDFCYPNTPIVLEPGIIQGLPSNIEQIVQDLGYGLNQIIQSLDQVWDHTAIQNSIRSGEQYELAALWEMLNPITYRVGSHDCVADVFVPSVKVVDNCSGVHSIKAMVDVQGGTRTVELEQTDVEIKITANGDTCYVYTYEHLTNPIQLPFDGCDGSLTAVRYEAADNCWNQSEWYKFITVADDVPPTVITDRNLNVTLQDKFAWVKAADMDEGSWDNCAIDLMLARRTDWNNCVSICENITETYTTWNAILTDLGLGSGDTEPDFAFLKTLLSDDEVEDYFYDQIVWLWEDGANFGEKVVQAWLNALAAYIGENCSAADEHGNVLRLQDLETLIDELFGQPGYGNELAVLGGGWAKEVPVKCEDACQAVTGELLVFDYCCNWGTQWTDIHVEDNSHARLVKRLPDLSVSCEAYNTFYKEIVDVAASYADGGSGADTVNAFAALDGAFGSYLATWVDSRDRPTDIEGNLLPESDLGFDYWNVTCVERSEEEKIAVYNHDSTTIGWVTEITKTTYLDTATNTANNGIIGINCAGTVTQDVWVDLDDCGQGTITRRFYVTSGCGDHAPKWEVEQVITIESACGMRESMFDLPASVGTKEAPICLPRGLSVETQVETQGLASLPDAIGSVTLKPHLVGKLCNSFAVGPTIKEYQVQGVEGLVKYVIDWSVIDWCADAASTNREFTYTQEVIAVIDPTCDAITEAVGSGVNGAKGVVNRKVDNREFILYQNYPNPYEGNTIIGFHLPERTNARLTIYDVTGRLIQRIEGNYNQGYNEVQLSTSDLNASGVLYYQLATERFTATKRMVVVRE